MARNLIKREDDTQAVFHPKPNARIGEDDVDEVSCMLVCMGRVYGTAFYQLRMNWGCFLIRDRPKDGYLRPTDSILMIITLHRAYGFS